MQSMHDTAHAVLLCNRMQRRLLHHPQVLSMALTPTLAALGAKFAGMQMEAEADDSQPSAGGEAALKPCRRDVTCMCVHVRSSVFAI